MLSSEASEPFSEDISASYIEATSLTNAGLGLDFNLMATRLALAHSSGLLNFTSSLSDLNLYRFLRSLTSDSILLQELYT
jgi:hypothetical protein